MRTGSPTHDEPSGGNGLEVALEVLAFLLVGILIASCLWALPVWVLVSLYVGSIVAGCAAVECQYLHHVRAARRGHRSH